MLSSTSASRLPRHSDIKIDILAKAHNLISESKDVVKGLQAMMPKPAVSDRASARSSQGN